MTGYKSKIRVEIASGRRSTSFKASLTTSTLPKNREASTLKITTPGVQLPITKEVYEPILKELETFGITFHEKEVPYLGYNPLNV